MTFLLILFFCLGLVLTVLSIRKRRKSASRSGRYRSPVSMSMGRVNIDQRNGTKKSGRSFTFQPAHIFMGAVLLMMVLWLAGGYFLPSGETPGMMSETRAEAAPSPTVQRGNLSGRIVDDGSEAVNTSAGRKSASSSFPQVPPEKMSGSLYVAAQSVIPEESRLSQVGLMAGSAPKAAPKAPAAQSPKAAAPKRQAPKAAAPAPAEKTAARPAAQETALAEKAAAPQPQASAPVKVAATGRASMVAAASASSQPQLATKKPKSGHQGILSASRQFTVLVGSFRERDNAEKYQSELANAGEDAFVVAADVEGQLWHRVMSGRFGTRPEAEAHGRDLKRRGLDTGRFLVRSLD